MNYIYKLYICILGPVTGMIIFVFQLFALSMTFVPMLFLKIRRPGVDATVSELLVIGWGWEEMNCQMLHTEIPSGLLIHSKLTHNQKQ